MLVWTSRSSGKAMRSARVVVWEKRQYVSLETAYLDGDANLATRLSGRRPQGGPSAPPVVVKEYSWPVAIAGQGVDRTHRPKMKLIQAKTAKKKHKGVPKMTSMLVATRMTM